MRRYLWLAGGLLAFFLTAYLVVDAAGVPLLVEPHATLADAGPWAAGLGVGLLVVDAFVPVASSVVMLSVGALYGPLAGSCLALVGRLGAWLCGFAVGRRAGGFVERKVPEPERARAERLLTRHGALAVVITRPVPLLGETLAVLAGASRMSWARGALAALVGSIPEAVTYALAGGAARSFEGGALLWVLLLAVSGLFWAAALWRERRPAQVGAGGLNPRS